jgi:polyhydroxybutyrate depolymerase
MSGFQSGGIAKVLVLGLSLMGLVTLVRADNVEHGITFQNMQRSYLLHVPPRYASDLPRTLVMVLHGGGGNASNAVKMTGMGDLADREGFLVVCLPEWNGRQNSFPAHLECRELLRNST